MTLQIKSLTDQMRIIELDKKKLNNKLQDAVGQNNELTGFIKSLQNQSDTEMNSMRAFLQQKVTDDQTNSQKSNEKNSILFNELVRIGKQTEAHQERLQSVTNTYEERINLLEQRLLTTE